MTSFTRMTRDLMIITAAAAAASLVVLGEAEHSESSILPPSDDDRSKRISWDMARPMMDDYLSFRPLYVKYEDPESSGDSIIDYLQGFVFEPRHLREIIANNGNLTEPDEIIFYIGQHGTFRRPEDGLVYPNLSLIALGMKERVWLNEGLEGRQVSLFDKAVPCPPYCPD